MLPRDKLKQCFTCKNNIKCWGLDEDIPLSRDEKVNSIESDALSFFIARNLGEKSIVSQFASLCACFIVTLTDGMDKIDRDVSQVTAVLCARCNTPNDGWVCPGEDETVEDEWTYEARK